MIYSRSGPRYAHIFIREIRAKQINSRPKCPGYSSNRPRFRSIGISGDFARLGNQAIGSAYRSHPIRNDYRVNVDTGNTSGQGFMQK